MQKQCKIYSTNNRLSWKNIFAIYKTQFYLLFLPLCATVTVDTFSSCARAERIFFSWGILINSGYWSLRNCIYFAAHACVLTLLRTLLGTPPQMGGLPTLALGTWAAQCSAIFSPNSEHFTHHSAKATAPATQASNGKSFDKRVLREGGGGRGCAAVRAPLALYALGQPVRLLLLLFSIVGNNSYGTMLSLYFNAP